MKTSTAIDSSVDNGINRDLVDNAGVPLGAPLLLTSLLGIYIIQSMVGMFSFQGVPAILRAEGISTMGIGALYLLMLPWALKFSWAPVVERYRHSAANFLPHMRLSLTGNLLLAVFFVLLTLLSVTHSLVFLFVCLFVMAFVSTVVDISGDGFAVDQLFNKDHSIGNMAQVGGSYIGTLIGGGLFMYLVGQYSWQIGLYLLAVMTVLMALPLLFLRNRKNIITQPVLNQVRPSVAAAWRRPSVRKTLLLVIAAQFGTRLILAMMMPFFIDRGLPLADLGLIAAGGGVPAGLVGVVVGGLLVRKWGALSMLKVLLLVEIITALCFIALTVEGGSDVNNSSVLLIALFIAASMMIAAKFVVIYTLMMNRAKGSQSGVDFTLFQSADMAIAIIAALLGGWLIAQFGYFIHFSAAITTMILALLLLIVSESFSDYSLS
ncbi:MAG: MFS transporter [Cellvibrionaceae bacterium]|nr:MFS transporter [Cellvibrionaceae bacterium]